MENNNTFFQDLRREHIACVQLDELILIPELSDEELSQWHETAAASCPLTAPALDTSAARWAARQVYLLCRFIIDRQLDPQAVNELLRQEAVPTPSIETAWSTDLFFRQLPRIYELAVELSRNDPLLENIRALAQQWTLSAVGLPNISGETHAWQDSPSLWQLYIERIIQYDDREKISTSAIKSAVLSHLGIYSELHPQLFNALKDNEHDA